ncbi:MAG: sigma-70 family RNA polymerase sigma factor [Massilia sp.]
MNRPYGLPQPEPQLGTSAMVCPEEGGLWEHWRIHGDMQAREALARLYVPYARALAAKAYSRRATDELEFDEYLQFATVGMMESLDRFDPAQGVLFKTFATRRITGAILDGVQTLSERYQQLALSRRIAKERLESLAEETTAASPETMLRELAGIGIGLALGFILDGTGMVESQDAASPDTTYTSLELRQFRHHVAEVLKQLTAREQEVIKMHYFNSVSFDEIARHLELTKGRISQLHKRAIARLRSLLTKGEACDVEL